MSNDHEPPKPPARVFGFERGVLAFTLLALAIGWTVYGAIYYQRVLPFFDSVAYQESFVRIVGRTGEVGIWQSLREAWLESSNVALFRLWAALCGRLIPAANEGLYFYIYGIHFVATGLLVRTVTRASQVPSMGVFAAAAWLAARPFAETVNGVLDQRMDLASGSFCLAVTALLFDWSDKPSRWSAGWAGLAAALAVLHRPVMAVTVAAIALVFIARALLRHRARRREWVLEIAWMLLSGLVLTVPWLIYHARGLHYYYLVWNVAVGNVATVAEAAAYNLAMFRWSMGTFYPWLIAAPLVWAIARRRIHWLDLGAVALCLVIPLALLMFSRSTGNYLVCQVALGMPALALASIRRQGTPETKSIRFTAVAASTLLMLVAGHSLFSLSRQIDGIDRTPRMETLRWLHDFDRQVALPSRIVTGFQTIPLDTSALAALARQERINFQAGTSFFHPMDFGIPNAGADSLTDDQVQGKVAELLRGLRGRSTLVMLATEETEGLLPPTHFSQVRTKVIRRALRADAGMVLRHTTPPVGGIKFDVYEMRQGDSAP